MSCAAGRWGWRWGSPPTGCSATRRAGTRWPGSAGRPAPSSAGCTPTRRARGVVHVAAAGRWRGVRRRAGWATGTLPTAAATWAVLGGAVARPRGRGRRRTCSTPAGSTRPSAADPPGRPRHQPARRGRGRPGRHRVGRREHLRRGRRPAGLGRPGSVRPGLLGYRAANTLDAMVGHRSARYERFGWAAARLDDLLNLPGSRLTAALAALLGARPARARLRAWRRDAAGAPEPERRPGRGGVRRARSGSGSAAPTPTARPASSTARCSATAGRRGSRRPPGAGELATLGRRGGAHRAATHRRAASTSLTVSTPAGRPAAGVRRRPGRRAPAAACIFGQV